jgi:hypothetical protein
MPSYPRRITTVSAGQRAAPAHQVQPLVGRSGPCLGRQPRHTSTRAAHGSNRGVPLAKQCPSRRTRSAAQHEVDAHAKDATDIRCGLIRIDTPNVSRCGDYLKALYWDGSGLCLFAKRLEKGRFVWPPIVDGAMTLTPAQLALLIEAMDWRRTVAPGLPVQPMLV